jgi:hypothetical protein
VCVIAWASIGCGGPALEATDAGADVVYGKKPIVPDAGTPEAGIDCNAGDTPSRFFPAPHPALPTLISAGGPVLAHPRFVPIVFAAEDRTSDIATFTSRLATSATWTSVAAQYGVGAATSVAPIVVDETPPALLTDADVQSWLADKLDGTHADFGAPDSSSIYVVFYPAATTIDAGWGSSCEVFDGYHSETTVASTRVVYATISRCDATPVSVITTHELFEAATDPFVFSAPAFVRRADETPGTIDEIGDLCEGKPAYVPSDVGYLVPKMWSNASVAGAHEPCVPIDDAPYFRTTANVDDVLTQSSAPRGLKLAPGASTTIDLIAFSDRSTNGPWQIAVTRSWVTTEDQLALWLCRSTAENGEHVPLTITRPATSTVDDSVEVTSTSNGASTTFSFVVGD